MECNFIFLNILYLTPNARILLFLGVRRLLCKYRMQFYLINFLLLLQIYSLFRLKHCTVSISTPSKLGGWGGGVERERILLNEICLITVWGFIDFLCFLKYFYDIFKSGIRFLLSLLAFVKVKIYLFFAKKPENAFYTTLWYTLASCDILLLLFNTFQHS